MWTKFHGERGQGVTEKSDFLENENTLQSLLWGLREREKKNSGSSWEDYAAVEQSFLGGVLNFTVRRSSVLLLASSVGGTVHKHWSAPWSHPHCGPITGRHLLHDSDLHSVPYSLCGAFFPCFRERGTRNWSFKDCAKVLQERFLDWLHRRTPTSSGMSRYPLLPKFALQANRDWFCSLNDMIFPLYTGVDMGDHPQSWGFNNRQHEKCSSLHYYFPVPPKTLSYRSTVVTNCEGHWCCHRTSLGWSCL